MSRSGKGRVTSEKISRSSTGREIARRTEWEFFLGEDGSMEYCEKCRMCEHDCKQSFRAVVTYCPIYKSKYRKEWSKE